MQVAQAIAGWGLCVFSHYLIKFNMALVSCSECKQEISDKATSCPHCGSPVKVPTPPVIEVVTNKENPPVFQLELTAKRWKKVILAAWAMLFLGIILTGILAPQNQQGLGLTVIFISVITWITGKIGAWYSNR